MKFDDILKDVGEFGKYQKVVYFLLCLPSFATGLFMMHLVFVMETPNYRCKIADYPDDTFGVKDPGHQRLVEMTIPRDSMGDYEKCSFYSYQTNRTILMFNSSDLQENFTIGVNATLQKCSEWVYEKSVFKETYTSKSREEDNSLCWTSAAYCCRVCCQLGPRNNQFYHPRIHYRRHKPRLLSLHECSWSGIGWPVQEEVHGYNSAHVLFHWLGISNYSLLLLT